MRPIENYTVDIPDGRFSIGMSDTASDTSEIEIMPEMIKVGAEVVFAQREGAIAWVLAEEIYRAMERERRNPRTTPSP